MNATWDGVTRPETIQAPDLQIRNELADAARRHDWPSVLAQLAKSHSRVNATRPGGASLYTPLHQAAHGGAPLQVVERMIAMGAWRTLQNAQGERALDVAGKRGHARLSAVLAPVLKRHVPIGILLRLQAHFHDMIRGRADRHVKEHALRLPELEPLLEYTEVTVWFPVPGMYGGFSYRLVSDGVEAKLACESWSRVVEGSGQRHEITSAGCTLLEEGFV